MPLGLRPRCTFATDLVDAPVDLQAGAIGVAKLHGELTPGAAATFEVDGHLVLVQVIAGA